MSGARNLRAIPAQPDIEAFAWAQLRHLPGVTSFCVAAVPMPLVPWQVAYTIQVSARAKTKAGAWDRAEQARRIVWGLASVPWPEGDVTYVQVTEGPMWSPDDDGAPHYVIRAEVRVHPSRTAPGGSAGAVPAAAAARPIGGRT